MNNATATRVPDIGTIVKRMGGRQELNQLAREIREKGQRILTDCFAIGERLLKARNLIRANYKNGERDGRWREWLDEDVKMTHRQANRFILVYEKYGKGGGAAPLLKTSFSVLAELAAADADPKARRKIEERLEKGEQVTQREARKARKPAMKPRSWSGSDVWLTQTRDYLFETLKAHPDPAERLWIKKWLQDFIDHI